MTLTTKHLQYYVAASLEMYQLQPGCWKSYQAYDSYMHTICIAHKHQKADVVPKSCAVQSKY